MVARGLHDKRLVEHERRTGESRIEIAEGPLLERLAHRQASRLLVVEILGRPLDRLERPRPFTRRGSSPRVPLQSRTRAVGPEAVERIGDKRQRLEIDFDPFDRLGGRQLIGRGHRENRLAGIKRLIRQRAFRAAEVG